MSPAEYGFPLTVASHVLLQVADLRQGRVLTASAQQVAEAVERNASVTALIEQRKRLLVVGGSLRVEVVRSHVYVLFSPLR